MRYSEIFDLKYRKGIPTQELMRRYPGEIRRISEIALLDLNTSVLRRILPRKKSFSHVLQLKTKFWHSTRLKHCQRDISHYPPPASRLVP